jgi:two-component system, cell cycle response regulator
VADLIARDGIGGRLGGEEFALILPGCGMADATARAEQLRADVQDLRIRAGDATVTLSCSFGVSSWTDSDSVEALIKRADVALYAAKSGGRNRVVASPRDAVPVVAK